MYFICRRYFMRIYVEWLKPFQRSYLSEFTEFTGGTRILFFYVTVQSLQTELNCH